MSSKIADSCVGRCGQSVTDPAMTCQCNPSCQTAGSFILITMVLHAFLIFPIVNVTLQVTVARTLYPRATHALLGDAALLETILVGHASVPLNAQTAMIAAPITRIYAAELVQQVITCQMKHDQDRFKECKWKVRLKNN